VLNFFYQALQILPSKSLSCRRIERRPLISFETFVSDYFLRQMPVIITGCMEQWPACTKWKDLNYLKRIARDRTVPVEVIHFLVPLFFILLSPRLYVIYSSFMFIWLLL
jgi:cellulose synthase/poly-beta-1,6-N-acetylglucosamine synthase-like glycosyltransferase